MPKKKPNGFIAKCQCGQTVGAMDYARTPRKDAGRLLGEWLHSGCTVIPKFGDAWCETVGRCICEDKRNDNGNAI